MLPVNMGEGRPRKGRYQTRKGAVGWRFDVSVFVLDRKKKPLMPCSEKRARLLLTRGKAVVDRMYPFTIRLRQRVGGEVQPVRVKLDPGAKVTGVAIVREAEDGQHVLHLAEIAHKGALVRIRMRQRATYRRRRPSAHLRYRAKLLGPAKNGAISAGVGRSQRCRRCDRPLARMR